jgi:hypothetical protein
MSFAGRRSRNKVKKGVQFTIMVVGASGTGRTTFVNTLCETDVLGHKEAGNPADAHIEQGVRIQTHGVGTRAAAVAMSTGLTGACLCRVRGGWCPNRPQRRRHARLWRQH